MTKDKDYRNTQYCLKLEDVEKKKAILENKIKAEFPRIKIIYNKIHDRKGVFHSQFANIYNKKCAYCGAYWGLLPTEFFEVDHFINEASYEDTTDGRVKAGKLKNLVWSCIWCNRGKSGLTIRPPYDDILNVDNGNIAEVFFRNEDFSISISGLYQDNEFIQDFYKSLHLGYETRRLDYLGLQLLGRYQNEKNQIKKSQLGEMLAILMQKRNGMKLISETEG